MEGVEVNWALGGGVWLAI